jgi:hypothetical protein
MDKHDLHPDERAIIEKMQILIRRRDLEEDPRFGFPKRFIRLTSVLGRTYRDWGWNNVLPPPQKRRVHLRDLWNLLKTNGEYSQLEMRPQLRLGPTKRPFNVVGSRDSLDIQEFMVTCMSCMAKIGDKHECGCPNWRFWRSRVSERDLPSIEQGSDHIMAQNRRNR